MLKGDWMSVGMIVVVLVGVGAFFFFVPRAPQTAYGPVEVTGSTMTATSPAPYRVDAFVMLKQPGFVTIHQSVGDAPGPIVATSLYMDTTTLISSIAVDPPMIVGAPYVALLHVDNGDMVFTVEDDLPVMSEGKVVRANFTAQEESADAVTQ